MENHDVQPGVRRIEKGAAQFTPGIARKISEGEQRFQPTIASGHRPHRFASSPGKLASEGRPGHAATERHSLLCVDDTQNPSFVDKARLCKYAHCVRTSTPLCEHTPARHTVRGCLEGVFAFGQVYVLISRCAL